MHSSPPTVAKPTLAEKLGMPCHVSPLLLKLKRHGLTSPREMWSPPLTGVAGTLPGWRPWKGPHNPPFGLRQSAKPAKLTRQQTLKPAHTLPPKIRTGPGQKFNPKMKAPNQKFWDEHGRVGLIWSNPKASDDTLIAAALLRQPNFHLLLDIATHFGLDRLKTQWERLQKGMEECQYPEDLKKLQLARPIVERCLKTMEEAICLSEPQH